MTEVSKFDNRSDGHIIIAPLSKKTRQAIYDIQNKISDTLPVGSLWLPSGKQLHITFAHLISPDATYDSNKDDLWRSLEVGAKKSLYQITTEHPKIDIVFEKIEAFLSTIIVKWKDDGVIDELRRKFTKLVQIPKNTRVPPNIIHTTIARFKKEISFEEVKETVARLEWKQITENISSLELIHEEKIFVQEHSILNSYLLK